MMIVTPVGTFPEGTQFFSDECEPVAVLPGGKIINCFGGRAVEVPATEFGRNRPPMEISFAEFLARAKTSTRTPSFVIHSVDGSYPPDTVGHNQQE